MVKSELEKASDRINKEFDESVIMPMDSSIFDDKIEAISTGVFTIDYAIGIGGIPKGRIIEIFGNESCGKTSLAILIAAELQKQGKSIAYIDAEHAFDMDYAVQLGLRRDLALISQPDSGEQALDIAEKLLRNEITELIIIDSVAALTPQAILQGEMGDNHMGIQARLMGQGINKLKGLLSKNKASIIFINQLRQKIGVMFGSPDTTPGGLALKFYASVRIEMKKIETKKSGDKEIAHVIRAKIVKNKVAPPFKTAKFTIVFGKGIFCYDQIIDMAIEKNIIEKSGGFLKLNGETYHGIDKLKNYLHENKDTLQEIKNKIQEEK